MPGGKADDTQQPVISSFFKPKPTPNQPTSHKPPPPKRAGRSDDADILILSDSSDEGGAVLRPQHPPAKKVKLEQGECSPTAGGIFAEPFAVVKSTPKPRATNPKVLKWKYNPDRAATDAVPTSSLTQDETAARRARIASKLLGVKDLLNRQSAYLQKEHYLAANAEASGSQSPASGAPLFSPEDDDGDEMDDDAVEDLPANVKGKGKAKARGKGKEDAVKSNRFGKYAAKDSTQSSTGGKPIKYTPLEQQVLALKKKHPGVLLMWEVGYKYRFFEEDAVKASRLLGIAHFVSKHMLTASIPTHRLDAQIKKLLNAGEKVGVVRQQETAALKKIGDNRSAPFTRALQGLYTSATYIDELNVDPLATFGSRAPTIMCIVEEAAKKDQAVKLGMVAVVPSTGEVIYDEFTDSLMRSELETRLLHLQPSELVLQGHLSKQTDSMVQYLIGQHDAGVPDFKCRIDRVKKLLKPSEATSFVSNFLAQGKPRGSDKDKPDEIVIDDESDSENGDASTIKSEPNKVLDLPKLVLVALAALIQHLKAFSLDTLFLHEGNFHHFSSRSALSLNGNTLANLEILQNATNFTQNGSLLSVIDHCKTPFGRRKMRQWITRPLLSVSAVEERLDAVEEIAKNASASTLTLSKIRDLFRGVPDLERGLVRIQVGKATPAELLRVLQAFQRIGDVFEQVREEDEEAGAKTPRQTVKSPILKRIVESLPTVKKPVRGFLARLDLAHTRDGKKEEMFKELTEAMQDSRDCRDHICYEMGELLVEVRKSLKKPGLNFVKVGEEEFLIEIRAGDSKIVPVSWPKINSTKAVGRYRPPEIQAKMEELARCKETLAAAAETAYQEFLREVSASYELFRAVTSRLAEADCLWSFALTALEPGYTRPKLSHEPGHIEIENGRHPIIEVTSPQPFVPNTIKLGGASRPKQVILTGLNMGGKSSLSRATALIALMAQIGCYVPADSCTTSLFDGIYTRMGASDEIARGRSTFMVELSETSEILKMATPRSLVILDELGRGTSTSDGQAIASAVLQHIVTSINCTTMFVTHYPSLAEIAKRFPESVAVAHMACLETKRDDGFSHITFLYKLAEGLASRSHGLNVARLAGLPDSVLASALVKSRELEESTESRLKRRRAERMSSILTAVGHVSTSHEKQALLETCLSVLA